MSSKYCGTMLIKHGTSDEKIKKAIQICWDIVPLNPNYVGHLEILCVKWFKRTLAGVVHLFTNVRILYIFKTSL